ncbi:MAG: glycosyltransferase family 4 protein [Desulfosoma sp.]
MVRRGHRIDWILQSEAPCRKSYRTSRCNCTVWVGKTDNGTSRWARLKKNVLHLIHSFLVFPLAHRNDYDFIQVKDPFLVATVAMVAAKATRKKFFYWMSFPIAESYLHAARDGSARYPMIYRLRGAASRWLLYRVIMPRADHVFVQSEQMKRDVMGEGIPPWKLTPVPTGVSIHMVNAGTTNFKQDRAVLPAPPSIVYLGTLVRVRKLDFLLRVFSMVLEEFPEVRLYLVGDGEDPEDARFLQREARKLGISDAVVFTGFLPRDQALRLVAKADVAVIPFYPTPILNSTSPNKLIEYMALGKPVVANDHPEQRLIIEESGGGICVPYEEGAFARAILELMRDPTKAAEMGQKGRAYVLKHRTYPRIAQELEHEYFRHSCHVPQEHFCFADSWPQLEPHSSTNKYCPTKKAN